MRSSFLIRFLLIMVLINCTRFAVAQFIDSSANRLNTPLKVDMKLLGTLKPRPATTIKSSRITVGCETLDRDFTVWDNYKSYLRPLGAKKIRLQAGWAKCEKVPGTYDWKWLDEIIDYAVANGLEPWLQPSYGNPAYPGGGGINLLNSLMTTPEAYAAWDRWVEALVIRYKNRVREWEIWNEPDHPGQKLSPETTAELNIRTAMIIKRVQPEAKIAGLAFASNSDKVYLDRFLKVIADQNKLDLFQWISYHSYTMRPEDAYTLERVLGLREVINKYSPKILLRQGENGAPSTYIPGFALDKYYWTEYTQAKYDMRRLLGDLGHDIETSVFTIIDIYYDYGIKNNPNAVLNTKGLIQSDNTKAAIRPKVAYYAVQNITSVFDDELTLNPLFSYEKQSGDNSLSVYNFVNQVHKKQVVAIWLDGANVSNSFETKQITVDFRRCKFSAPVWVDLITGRVYEIPANKWKKSGDSYSFTIPVYDAPIIIAERSMLTLVK